MDNGTDRNWADVTLPPENIAQALDWKSPRIIYVGSKTTDHPTDLFHETVSDEQLDRLFAIIALCPQHIFLLATRIPKRMREYLLNGGGHCINVGWRQQIEKMGFEDIGAKFKPLDNVWLGVVIENQKKATEFIPTLLDIPATKHFALMSPMLGSISLTTIQLGTYSLDALRGVTRQTTSITLDPEPPVYGQTLDWVICAGETGVDARPTHPDWVRSIRDQCAAVQVPFWFEKWGEWYVPDDGEPACRVCGCTQFNACDEGCWWVEDDLCSSCVGLPIPEGDRPVKYRFYGEEFSGRLLDFEEHNGRPEVMEHV